MRWLFHGRSHEVLAHALQEEKPAATPIFGSGFSSAAGFGGFTGVTLPASTAAKAEEGDAEEGDAEEECKAEFKPLVQLEAVDTETGEEGETCIMESCVSVPMSLAALALHTSSSFRH